MLGKVASWHQTSNPGGWKLTFPTQKNGDSSRFSHTFQQFLTLIDPLVSPTLNLSIHIPLIALLPSPHHQHQDVRPIPGPSRWTGRCACDSSRPRCPLHRPRDATSRKWAVQGESSDMVAAGFLNGTLKSHKNSGYRTVSYLVALIATANQIDDDNYLVVWRRICWNRLREWKPWQSEVPFQPWKLIEASRRLTALLGQHFPETE